MNRIIVFLIAVCAILMLVLSYTFHRINSLESQKNDLKEEVLKKDTYIKEMEKINEVLKKVEEENTKFKEQLLLDDSDNLDVVPAAYILDQLHAD